MKGWDPRTSIWLHKIWSNQTVPRAIDGWVSCTSLLTMFSILLGETVTSIHCTNSPKHIFIYISRFFVELIPRLLIKRCFSIHFVQRDIQGEGYLTDMQSNAPPVPLSYTCPTRILGHYRTVVFWPAWTVTCLTFWVFLKCLESLSCWNLTHQDSYPSLETTICTRKCLSKLLI